jgi:hypothetical protein
MAVPAAYALAPKRTAQWTVTGTWKFINDCISYRERRIDVAFKIRHEILCKARLKKKAVPKNNFWRRRT